MNAARARKQKVGSSKKKQKDKIEKFLKNTAGKQGRRRKIDDPESEVIVPEKRGKYTIMEGCRVMNVGKLAETMWCNNCDDSVSLRNVIKEKQYGIASKLTVICQRCQAIVLVSTSEMRSGKIYDTNLKLAAGMLDAGAGETKINTVMSSLNAPTVSATSIKRHERRVGKALEKLAKSSCVEAIKIERRLTLERSSKNSGTEGINDDGEQADLTVSGDCAWTKRGRQHNSLSGHSTLIGHFSGKILSYACRDIYCRQCKINKDKEHDCKRNHSGTSRAMEADMAVEMVLKNDDLVKLNCRVAVIIGDDDSASLSALRRLSPYTIQKWSDFNHVKKTFNSKLWDMKLSANLREYFARLFSIAIRQNQGDEVKVKVALQSIVPHAFGDHTLCGSYCKTDENGIHVYKYFKDGKCLTDIGLKEKLEKIIQPYINNVAQIAPCASSQSNESWNNTACSKHNKTNFYGGSESHAFRVAAAVCQKNLGYEYVVLLNKLLELSPGKNTEVQRAKKQNISRTRAKIRQTVPAKKRRLMLQKERSSRNVTLGNREGISYQSGCGYLNTSDLIDEVMLPDNVSYADCFLVVFDTETTGLSLQTDQIVQIAAVCGGKKFSQYIMPTKNMCDEASEVTGITISNGVMYLNGKEVSAVSARDALLKFFYFLKSLDKPSILVSHNGVRFDTPRLIKLIETVGLMKEAQVFIKGFCDSINVFKSLLPERLKCKPKKSFKQEDLVDEFLDTSDILSAHDALNDVIMLEKLLKKLCKDTSVILSHTQSFGDAVNTKKRNAVAKNYKDTLSELDISSGMKTKISQAGINLSILREAHNTGGLKGLQILLGENVGGKPRVTANKKIIEKIFQSLSK